MSDLVERLRDERRTGALYLRLDAADEIERLRAALHKIAYEPVGNAEASPGEVLAGCEEIARAALSSTQGREP